ncbi:MAG: hypothetical protein K1X74_10510 [Pirellulales bacterium]|nr:hypothetical protein [Pirellulales bacterium]
MTGDLREVAGATGRAPRAAPWRSVMLLAAGALVLVVVLIQALVPWLHRIDRTDWAAAVVREDGLFESLGAMACLVASVGCFATAAALRRHVPAASMSRVAAWVALGAMLLLMFGEEISWGQRVLGFATPEWARKGNIQREFNLHNLRFFHPALNLNWLKLLWSLASVVYLGLAPLAFALVRRRATPNVGHAVPVAGPVIGACMVASFIRYWVGTQSAIRANDNFGGHEIGEAFEATIELLYLALVVEGFLALRENGWNLPVARWLRALGVAVSVGLVICTIGWWRSPELDSEALAGIHYRRGRYLLDQGRLGEACEEFRLASQAVPDAAIVYLDWANALALNHRDSEAAAHYEDYLRYFPDSPLVWQQLGLARLRLGQRGPAVAAFEQAIARGGDSPENRANLERAQALLP